MPSHAIAVREPFVDAGRARGLLAQHGLAALVASSLDSVYYLSGHLPYETVADPTSVSLVVLPADGASTLIHTTTAAYNFDDFPAWTERRVRYGDMYVSGAPAPAEPAAADAVEGLARVLRESGLERARVAFELDVVPWSFLERLRAALPDLDVADGGPVLRELRLRKSPLEIELMRHAYAAVERAITTALDEVRPGATERDVDRRIRVLLAEDGVEPVSVFVGANERGAQVISWATDRVLAEGDVLRVDVCAARGRHHADLARNVAVGRAPRELADMYRASRRAMEAAVEAVGPGVPVRDVFAAGVAVARELGLHDFERHHLGHGVGLQVHEWPLLGAGDDLIPPDSVLSLEAPYYRHGLVGVSPEDAVLVTADGVERWTYAPDELPEVGA